MSELSDEDFDCDYDPERDKPQLCQVKGCHRGAANGGGYCYAHLENRYNDVYEHKPMQQQANERESRK